MNNKELFIDIFKITNADMQMLEEMKKQLENELKKPESEQDSELISELRESIAEIVSETEKEKAFLQEKAEQLTALSNKKSKTANIYKWLFFVAACFALVIGLNKYTMTAFGTPLYSFVYQFKETGVHVNFEQNTIELPTSEGDPYGIKAKCAEYGFYPLTPAYIPEDYKLVDIDMGEHPEYTYLSFRYKKFHNNYIQEEETLNFDYEFYKSEEYCPGELFSSDHNATKEEINGLNIETIKAGKGFTSMFRKDQTVYTIIAGNFDDDEYQKILENISE